MFSQSSSLCKYGKLSRHGRNSKRKERERETESFIYCTVFRLETFEGKKQKKRFQASRRIARDATHRGRFSIFMRSSAFGPSSAAEGGPKHQVCHHALQPPSSTPPPPFPSPPPDPLVPSLLPRSGGGGATFPKHSATPQSSWASGLIA